MNFCSSPTSSICCCCEFLGRRTCRCIFSLPHTDFSPVSIHTMFGVIFSAVQFHTNLDHDKIHELEGRGIRFFFAKSLLALEATSVTDTHTKTPSGAARLTDYYHLSLMNTWTFVIIFFLQQYDWIDDLHHLVGYTKTIFTSFFMHFHLFRLLLQL